MSTTDTITCHHGLGPAHPWEPDRYCPPEPVDPAPDTERDERLRGIQERAQAATEGPWTTYQTAVREGSGIAVDDDVMLFWNAGGGITATSPENAAFIAAARTDVPWLLAEVARLDAVVTAVRELHSLHKATRLPNGGYEWSCDECGADLDSDDDSCPTVRALDGGAS